jgi:hypothetical protein
MPVIDEDSRKNIKEELSRLHKELEIIHKWDRMFQTAEHNTDSYVARQRRRWEIILRIKALATLDERDSPSS